ncbi:polysaccharide biosynthesis/export family protein [Desulfobaculum bizertense]|uniref:Protein involved in polysaccharide export, contains SLBB domain of the beta-grasp fold n=1 Tax=Desulfobaculum bizertense DSM 18034 TaxID=1121442 RepID=A0A1T4WNR3_9BACT|nr:polysaccharide biosynthesis/export family protein [Desulfobaculum bizertense]SKA78992.1 protein involved in polysaccharide export, contains SLBB domain of the beta-grasp fold [Desulfobaculum bizertense DSM 18034]
MTEHANIDVVVIGVNAAATLRDCLESVQHSHWPQDALRLFYVDGGSVDESCDIALECGAELLHLEHGIAPTPGRGRNVGWQAGKAPYVQFLDSDTLLDPEWLATGMSLLQAEHSCAAVFGNRREQNPSASVYNWIADLEWNPPAGKVAAFGGDVLVRREALAKVGGYDEILVAGEDPDCSLRIGERGWSIEHVDVPMTMHDIGMTKLSQWARRAFRTGYGYAAVTHRHFRSQESFWKYECGRILARGGAALCAVLCFLLGLFSAPWLWGTAVAGFVLLYPRIFSIRKFMAQKQITRPKARTYAWHCTMVVVPQIFGMFRYMWGILTGQPLQNAVKKLATAGQRLGLFVVLALLVTLSACNPIRPEIVPDEHSVGEFKTDEGAIKSRFATEEAIAAFSQEVPNTYLMGPGDSLELKVWQRPELSDRNIRVAPDGTISVMRIGMVQVKGRSIQDVTREISKRLSKFYERPEVRLSVSRYANNKAFVLGRVTNPGLITFEGEGTLLEALALCGGLPLLRKEAFLSKCAIIRGRDRIVWVDLGDLLEGNMALNAKIMNNDVIYIPESEDKVAYVMGYVRSPGAIRLKSRITVLDAIMHSGGPAQGADMSRCYLVRNKGGKPLIRRISLRDVVEKGDFSRNYIVEDNDVIYIGSSAMTDFNYVMRSIIPMMDVLDLGTNVLERFGVMPHLREDWWGCLDCDQQDLKTDDDDD